MRRRCTSGHILKIPSGYSPMMTRLQCFMTFNWQKRPSMVEKGLMGRTIGHITTSMTCREIQTWRTLMTKKRIAKTLAKMKMNTSIDRSLTFR